MSSYEKERERALFFKIDDFAERVRRSAANYATREANIKRLIPLLFALSKDDFRSAKHWIKCRANRRKGGINAR